MILLKNSSCLLLPFPINLLSDSLTPWVTSESESQKDLHQKGPGEFIEFNLLLQAVLTPKQEQVAQSNP